MYSEEKIYGVIDFIKAQRNTRKPYLAICTPRRDEKELAAQDFTGGQKTLDIGLEHTYIYMQVSGKFVDEARNLLAEGAIQQDAKYLLYVGEDTVIPKHAWKTMHALAEANPDTVISGVYYFKAGPPMIFADDGEGRRTIPDVKPGKIIENPQLIGIDVMLIPVQILKELKEKEPECPFFCVYNIDNDPTFIGEDEFFLHLLYKNGYKVLVTTDVQCLHMDLATGKYTAHPSVNLKDYITQIKPSEILTSDDNDYLSDRWLSRLPKKIQEA